MAVIISVVLFFLHLVTFLSLYVKRGALPLAIGIQFLLFIFISTFGERLLGLASNFRFP